MVDMILTNTAGKYMQKLLFPSLLKSQKWSENENKNNKSITIMIKNIINHVAIIYGVRERMKKRVQSKAEKKGNMDYGEWINVDIIILQLIEISKSISNK